MSTVESFLSEPPRNGRGQYLMADESGKVAARTRATTFADAASDKSGLVNWKLRTVVAGLAARHDLWAMATTADPGDRDALRRIADDAFQAGAGESGANSGTALHEAARLIALGKLSIGQVAEHIRADVEAYFRELGRQGITEIPSMMERSVLNATYNVGGTLDRVVRYWPCAHCDRDLRVLDIKTGRDLSYGEHEFAVQQWLYASADRMFEPGSAERSEPMPEVCQHEAIIMHVPHGTGTAFAERIDLTMGSWGARLCAEVRAWRSFKALRSPLIPDTQAPPEDPFAGMPRTEVDDWTPADPIGALPQVNTEVASDAAPDVPMALERSKDDPEVVRMAELLLSSVPKAKGKLIMQQIARSLDPEIKLGQWAINIAKDIVRHPQWLSQAYELIETHVPVKHQLDARIALDVPATALTDQQNAVADAQVERIKSATPVTITGQGEVVAEELPGPSTVADFASANPFEPVFNEQYYLSEIAQASSKRALAELWQHASDHGTEWTSALNAAGMARMGELGM